MISTNKYVPAVLIRKKLLDIYPHGVFPKYSAFHNARLRAQMIIETATKNNQDPCSLVTRNNFPNLMQKLDDDSEAIPPEAILACQNIYRNVLNSCEGNNQLVNLLYQLSKADKGFTYKVFFYHRNKISGFMWQTSIMMSNFKRFSSCSFLDAI